MASLSRTPREIRRVGASVQLTARDAMLLRALARFRIARSSDLALLGFAGARRDTAASRLRRLFDAGYLEARVGHRTEENLYVLGPAGRAWVRQAGMQVRRVPTGGLEHHLSVVRTWVEVADAVHRMPGVRLDVVRPDWEIREEAAAENLPLIPDLLIQLSVEADGRRVPIRLALEVDRGTERGPLLPHKLQTYDSLRATDMALLGWQDFGLAIVLVGAGAVRRAAVQTLAARTWGGWFTLWTVEEGPDDRLRELVAAVAAPLTTSPYREGRGALVSVVAARDVDVRGGRQ